MIRILILSFFTSFLSAQQNELIQYPVNSNIKILYVGDYKKGELDVKIFNRQWWGLFEQDNISYIRKVTLRLDKLEPDPIIFMNENDSKFYGLDLNRKVKIKTRRGEISINIRLDDDLLPGMIFLPFCFKEAAANILTNSTLDPIGKIPELKFSAASVHQN